MVRVYVPATIGMLRHLLDEGHLTPVRGTAFSLTPSLREAYVSGSTEELEYAALLDAARASLRLLASSDTADAGAADASAADAAGGDSAAGDSAAGDAGAGDAGAGDSGSDADAGEPGIDEKEAPRRVVVAADLADDDVTPRPDLDSAVVRVAGSVTMDDIAAVHVDAAEAEQAVVAAAEAIDRADLGDLDAEFVLGDAEDHELAWYAPQELPFFLELM